MTAYFVGGCNGAALLSGRAYFYTRLLKGFPREDIRYGDTREQGGGREEATLPSRRIRFIRDAAPTPSTQILFCTSFVMF